MADAASLIMSGAALGLSFGQFAWQHLRKVDALVGTATVTNFSLRSAEFQFVIANLGTRPALFRNLELSVYYSLTQGVGRPDKTTPPEPVIKPGEIVSIERCVTWDDELFSDAKNAAEGYDIEIYFVAGVCYFNPKGVKMTALRHIATLYVAADMSRWSCPVTMDDSFRLGTKAGSASRLHLPARSSAIRPMAKTRPAVFLKMAKNYPEPGRGFRFITDRLRRKL